MTTTSVSLEQKTIDRADRIVDDRLIPGVKDRSGLIEYALQLFSVLNLRLSSSFCLFPTFSQIIFDA